MYITVLSLEDDPLRWVSTLHSFPDQSGLEDDGSSGKVEAIMILRQRYENVALTVYRSTKMLPDCF